MTIISCAMIAYFTYLDLHICERCTITVLTMNANWSHISITLLVEWLRSRGQFHISPSHLQRLLERCPSATPDSYPPAFIHQIRIKRKASAVVAYGLAGKIKNIWHSLLRLFQVRWIKIHGLLHKLVSEVNLNINPSDIRPSQTRMSCRWGWGERNLEQNLVKQIKIWRE